jgi:hypothetical protein
MQNRHMKIVFFITALLVIASLMMSGCSTPGFDGDKKINLRPKCYISNVPTEGEEYSANPGLYWYATDEDGFIKSYRFIVKTAEEINDDPLQFAEDVIDADNYDGWTVIFVDSLAPGKSATSDTVPLFAHVDPDIYTPQYFFVQAIDNHNLPSQFTDTVAGGDILASAFRMYSRNNNPPETYISFDTEKVYFSLTDTTALYQGISITWSGSDSLDYKRTQPTFQYHWQVYGPFDTQEEANTDDPSKFIAESYDTLTNSIWIKKQAVSLFDLYRNEGTSTMTRSNYFAFKVRSRDDAFVPDETPKEVVFYVVEPGFEKDILVVDNSIYIGQKASLRAYRLPEPSDPFIVEYQDYFKSIFSETGVDYDYYWYYRGPGYPDANGNEDYDFGTKKAPSLDTLLQYKLIINIKENYVSAYEDTSTHFARYEEYLKLGGKIMFIGWNNFSSAPTYFLNYFGANDFPYNFCGITAEYKSYWDESFDPSKPLNTPEEFIRAEAIVDDLPATLNVDEDQLNNYCVHPNQFGYRGNLDVPYYDYRENAEPWVNYFVKTTAAEAVYTAKSLFSSNAGFGYDIRDFYSMFSGHESIDGRVCGVRYDSGIFKSAVFGFSLYCMPETEAIDFLKAMIDWFYTEEIE